VGVVVVIVNYIFCLFVRIYSMYFRIGLVRFEVEAVCSVKDRELND
jgi:hypothetical protein